MFRTIFLPLLVLVVIAIGIVVYHTSGPNSAKQRALTNEQLAAQDAEMQAWLAKKYGGASTNAAQLALVAKVGEAIATKSDAKDALKPLQFILLAESNVIDLFALPTGEVYVTTALVNRMRTEGELAAALALGTAHVLAHHHLAMPAPPAAQIPQYTASQGTFADAHAVRILSDAGYSPEALPNMFSILTTAYQAGADTQFFATHPSTDTRMEAVKAAIAKLYPQGVPAVLSK